MDIEPKPRRRWFRFSLRTLFVLTLAVGVIMTWVAKERAQSRLEANIAEELRSVGGYGVQADMRDLYDDPTQPPEKQPWWCKFLGTLLGQRIVSIFTEEPTFRDLTPLNKLTNLQFLHLQFTQVTNLDPLSQQVHLLKLNLNGTSVRDLSPISKLRKIIELDLIKTKVSDLTPLADLKHLRVLYLNHTPVADIGPLAGCEALHILVLQGTQVHDLSPLAGHKKLKGVYLQGTPVTDLTPLAGVKQLDVVALDKSQVSDDQIASLQKALPKCQILRSRK